MYTGEIKRRVLLYRIHLLFGRLFFSNTLATVSLHGEIRHKSEYKVYDSAFQRLHSRHRRAILLINSEGGYIDGAEYLIDSLHRIYHHVATVNVEQCCSAAVSVYLASPMRFATKNSFFMIHHASSPLGYKIKRSKRVVRKILNLIRRHDKDLFYRICPSTNVEIEGNLILNKEEWNHVAELLAKYDQTFYSHIKGDINAVISHLKKRDNIVEWTLINMIRISKEMLEEKIGKGEDWSISAQEALQLGICHKII